jgi:hypothetical protein
MGQAYNLVFQDKEKYSSENQLWYCFESENSPAHRKYSLRSKNAAGAPGWCLRYIADAFVVGINVTEYGHLDLCSP